ncbi:MAG: RusA family crossover junction endodeoxyribonuclease [Phycisphaerales bacterium]|nr:RusA family crossover junction endodeoxyribonuclease [Phycisphaerales bacterium]
MEPLTFTVPGTPVPWARARTSGRRFFTDDRTASAKRRVALAAQAAGAVPIEGPVTVVLMFDYDADETRIEVMPSEGGKATRPDLDNLCKLVMDALNGVAWVDDGQVAGLLACKVEKKKRARKKKP